MPFLQHGEDGLQAITHFLHSHDMIDRPLQNVALAAFRLPVQSRRDKNEAVILSILGNRTEEAGFSSKASTATA